MDTPVAGGASPGIYSVSFRGQRGVAVGGDYAVPDAADRNAAWTADGGRTWHAPTGQGLGGYRSGSAWVNRDWGGGARGRPDRLDVSRDGSRSWSAFDTGAFDSVECVEGGPCYASGEKGRVAVLCTR